MRIKKITFPPKRYRITETTVLDTIYRLQYWRWYWPFWVSEGYSWGYDSLKEAQEELEKQRKRDNPQKKVVEVGDR